MTVAAEDFDISVEDFDISVVDAPVHAHVRVPAQEAEEQDAQPRIFTGPK